MNEKLKSYLDKVKAAVKKVSKKIWIIIGVVLVLIIAAVTLYANSRPYAVLFTGLTGDEASTIMTYLENQGIRNYRLENNDTILVPEGQEYALKARLLMEGYPKSGFGYSTYYDHVSALSTETERNTAWLITVQERMGATIRCLDGVKDATVGITQGENRSYVLDSSNVVEASAYVFVTMNSGQRLSNQQASAIRNLVARGVQGLQVDNITIVDNLGNQYSGASDFSDSEASALKLRLEEEQANKIRSEVMWVLAPYFGEENVKVAVNCVVDVSYVVTDEENTYLPDWAADGSTGGKGIIGSRVYNYTYYTDDETRTGGTVGTQTNSEIPEYVEREPNPGEEGDKVSGGGQLDYDNSHDKVHRVSTAGILTDCTVAVSINSATAGNVDIAQVRDHVAAAANITAIVTEEMTADEYLASKISVMSEPFYDPTQTGPGGQDPAQSGGGVPMWVLIAAAVGLLLFIIVLVLILVLRGKRRKKKAQEELDEAEALLALGAVAAAQGEQQEGADIMALQTERSMELRKDIRQFAEENPEIAAQLVKTWLRGESDND